MSFSRNLNLIDFQRFDGHDGRGFKFHTFNLKYGSIIHHDYFLLLLSSSKLKLKKKITL